MTYDEVLDMPMEALQETLHHKHIVVTGIGGQRYEFDEEGLRTVAVNLHQQITIHGLQLNLVPILNSYFCFCRSLYHGKLQGNQPPSNWHPP
jgi:hypothetical protein